MTLKTPSYLTRNRLGIYQFQYRVPARFKQCGLPKLVRKSLGTRDPKLAASLARYLATVTEHALYTQNANHNQIKQLLTTGTQKITVPSLALEAHLSQSPGENLTTSVHNPSAEPHGNIRLSEALNRYIQEKKKTWSAKSINSNERSTRLKLATFIEIVSDMDTSQLSKSEVVAYKSALMQLPSNRSKIKQYRGKTIKQLCSMHIPESDKLSIETLRGHFTKVSTFLDWLYHNGYSPADIKSPLSGCLGKSRPVEQQRQAFDDHDLQRLFNSKQYLEGSHKHPSHYFVPLLGLFTGARQNELCQLYTSDIYRERHSNIWVIDINDDTTDKRLKKTSHRRLVPIHPTLVELGLLDYLKSLQCDRLFPELRYKRDGYGQTFSRWFNEQYRSREHCNVGQSINERKNFHSFRHTFITKLTNDCQVPQHKAAHIVGHRPNDGSETIQRYTKQIDLIERAEIISKILYPSINLDSIQIWRK